MSKKPSKSLAALAKEALDMSKEARMARAEKMGFGERVWMHGTAHDINAFDPNMLGSNTVGPSKSMGFHFASDPNLANDYAEPTNPAKWKKAYSGANRKLDELLAYRNEAAKAHGGYKNEAQWPDKVKKTEWNKKMDWLAAQDELERVTKLRDANKLDEGAGNVVPVRLKMKNPAVIDLEGNFINHDAVAQAKDALSTGRYDGVIFKNAYDSPKPFDRNAKPSDVAIVADPSQIRSVNAKFDPKKKNSGNILDSLGPVSVGAVGVGATQGSDALAADLKSPIASGMGEVASQAGHALERFDAYTANPFRKFLNSALQGKGIIQSSKDAVGAIGSTTPTTGEEVATNFLSLSPNQNLGFPNPQTGQKEYPLAGPLGVAVDLAVDPTNIPIGGAVKAAPKALDAASSISRIIEHSLLQRGLRLP